MNIPTSYLGLLETKRTLSLQTYSNTIHKQKKTEPILEEGEIEELEEVVPEPTIKHKEVSVVDKRVILISRTWIGIL